MSTKQLPEGWTWEGDVAQQIAGDRATVWADSFGDVLTSVGEGTSAYRVTCIPAAVLRALLDSTPPRDESKPPPGYEVKPMQSGHGPPDIFVPVAVLPKWCATEGEAIAACWKHTEAPRSEPTDQGRALRNRAEAWRRASLRAALCQAKRVIRTAVLMPGDRYDQGAKDIDAALAEDDKCAGSEDEARRG